MNLRINAAPLAGALVTALFVAACSDRSASPVAPTAPSAANTTPSFSSSVAQQEALDHAMIHPTVEAMERDRAGHRRTASNNLTYHGGIGGIGVEAAPRVYVVFWGSQWSSDPSNEAAIVQDFLNGVGGSSWLDGTGAENGDKCAWITSGQGAASANRGGHRQVAAFCSAAGRRRETSVTPASARRCDRRG